MISNQLLESIEAADTLKVVAQSYTDIASTKLKHIRNGIEQARHFLAEIGNVYFIIKMVANAQKEVPKENRSLFQWKKPTVKVEVEQKRIASVLITSNQHFYGGVDSDTITFFEKNTTRFPTEKFVIGKIGEEYFKRTKQQATLLATKSEIPDANDVRSIIERLSGFDRILVFHPKFQTVLLQRPFIKDITEAEFEATMPKQRIDYIFEPEIDKMLTFFDNQISALMLEQAFLESELARTASRLIAMDQASLNATEFLKKANLEIAVEKRRINNSRLIETVNNTLFSQKQHYARNSW